MEKETKRYLLRVLDTMLEQQRATRASSDGLEDRIQRMIQEVGSLECFEINWAALCEKRLATRVSGNLDS